MVNMPDKFLQEADGNTERGTQFYGWTQGKDRAIEEEKEKTVRGPYERRKKGCQERRVKIIIKALYLENVVSTFWKSHSSCIHLGTAPSRSAQGPSRLGHGRLGRDKPEKK